MHWRPSLSKEVNYDEKNAVVDNPRGRRWGIFVQLDDLMVSRPEYYKGAHEIKIEKLSWRTLDDKRQVIGKVTVDKTHGSKP
jgi:hypothetical protein